MKISYQNRKDLVAFGQLEEFDAFLCVGDVHIKTQPAKWKGITVNAININDKQFKDFPSDFMVQKVEVTLVVE